MQVVVQVLSGSLISANLYMFLFFFFDGSLRKRRRMDRLNSFQFVKFEKCWSLCVTFGEDSDSNSINIDFMKSFLKSRFIITIL